MSHSSPASLCLFGGSFDPVHAGHLHIAKAAVDACALEKLVFIPCRQSPLKGHAAKASGQQRVDMLALATQNLEWADIDDLELSRSGPSYSWQTVTAYKDAYPKSKLYWLLGTDQWNQLHNWAEYEMLCRDLHFILYTRGDEALIDRPEAERTIISGNHPASSTAIREARSPSEWLNSDVADYIKRHSLYR